MEDATTEVEETEADIVQPRGGIETRNAASEIELTLLFSLYFLY